MCARLGLQLAAASAAQGRSLCVPGWACSSAASRRKRTGCPSSPPVSPGSDCVIFWAGLWGPTPMTDLRAVLVARGVREMFVYISLRYR